MNYKKIYDQIIERAKQRPAINGYKEKHHIIPRCLGGSDDSLNIVELTAREHFICHWLLAREYPDNSKLVFAFAAMVQFTSNKNQKRHIPSSRTVEEAKIQASFLRSQHLKAFNQTLEGKRIRREANAKVDQKAKIAKVMKKVDFAARARNTDWKKRTANFDYKKKVANTDYSKIAKKNCKPILQYTKDGLFITEWDSITSASNALGIGSGNLVSCLKGREKSAGGFVWKYR